MRDPSLPVSDALVTLLRGDAGVRTVTGGIPAIKNLPAEPTKARVFASVPSNVDRPYINLGNPQMVPVRASCLSAADVIIPIRGWTSGPKSVQSQQLGDAIVQAVEGADLQVTGFRVLYCEIEGVQYLDDPDPLTQLVVVEVRVQTEPA